MSLIRATPFHSRTAAANRLNAWCGRNGWTLPAHFGDPHAEALAARLTAAVSDISWRWRLKVQGVRAEEFLTRLLTRNPARLAPGQAFKALWLSDKGGVRGAGALARYGRESFLLLATESDFHWIARGASLFDVLVQETVENEGGLSLVGPFAAKIVEAAGLDASLDVLRFRKLYWRGLDVTLSRFGEHGGYEIWCNAEDAPMVWSRIARAGADFALTPAGLQAMDILDLEAGVPRPGRDFQPARTGWASSPRPCDLGLNTLIDEDHATFNGHAGCTAAPQGPTRVGIQFDDEQPAPHSPLLRGDCRIGSTMSSLYSPALQRAVALAMVDAAAAEPGTELSCIGRPARVAALPLLRGPDPVAQ